MSRRSSGDGGRDRSDVAKQLDSLMNAALHTKGGKVSASKVRVSSKLAVLFRFGDSFCRYLLFRTAR